MMTSLENFDLNRGDMLSNKEKHESETKHTTVQASYGTYQNGEISRQHESVNSSLDSSCPNCSNLSNQGPVEQCCGKGSRPNLSSRNTRSSLIHEVYETVTEITDPVRKDQPDVKAFFKVLLDHGLQSKLVYVMTVISIVAISHMVLSRRGLLPFYYTAVTPVLLLYRVFSYWKLKYQYFLLDFCYFANTYWYVYIWLEPTRENMFAVAFATANGPLIWALIVFRNSMVFHSLDKVTSLYIHVLPGLLSFVIRWYPSETSEYWHKDFPENGLGFSFLWLIGVPFVFILFHQIVYFLLVNVILRPSTDYMTSYRYIISKESSLLYRMCNLFGPRFTFWLYMAWCQLFALVILLGNLLWYNWFEAHCALLVTFITLAIYNGATYYMDVFQLQGSPKNKCQQDVTVEIVPEILQKENNTCKRENL